jgi:hypothetical protein
MFGTLFIHAQSTASAYQPWYEKNRQQRSPRSIDFVHTNQQWFRWISPIGLSKVKKTSSIATAI